MSFEEFAGLFPSLGLFPDSSSRGNNEHRQMIALAILGIENVITQAQPVFARLASKTKCMCWQVDRVAVAFRFEKLPQRANFQEMRGLALQLFHLCIKCDRLRLAL